MPLTVFASSQSAAVDTAAHKGCHLAAIKKQYKGETKRYRSLILSNTLS
jgi:hypothetical protein